MTLARLIETGNGSLAVRLSIEGIATEFVSDPAMVKTTSDGRSRVLALGKAGEGITLEESVNIPEATIEAQGQAIAIYETANEDVSKAFAWLPDIKRFVVGDVGIADTSITMLSTSGVIPGSVIHLSTEAILVAGVTSATVLDVTGGRGHWDTIPQKHWSADGEELAYAIATNRPMRIRGRRARVFLYGDGDDLQGDGTQKWIGMVSAEPRLSQAGTKWSLQIGSLSELLKTELGGELGVPAGPRGIYYHAMAPLFVRIIERDLSNAWRTIVADTFVGFFETQRAFVEALTTWLGTLTSGLDSAYSAVETTDARWTIKVDVGAATSVTQIEAVSPIDGSTGAGLTDLVDAYGDPAETWAAGDVYFTKWGFAEAPGALQGLRMVPRGYFGKSARNRSGTDPVYSSPEDWDTYPPDRVYLDVGVSADWGSLVTDWQPDGTSPAHSHEHSITERNTADSWVRLNHWITGLGVATFEHAYVPGILPTMKPVRSLAVGDLEAFRAGLETEGPLYANRGTAPFITSSDLASWATVVAEATRGRAWLQNRFFSLATPADLDEVLAAEMQLLGVFPIIDATGKIALATLKIPNATTVDTVVIDDEVISAGWSTWARNNETINTVNVSTGYDPIEDEWNGRSFRVRDVSSYSQDHQDRGITIEPRSRYTAGDEYVYAEDYADAMAPLLGLFGHPHALVSVNVSWKLFDTVMGQVVSFSAIHLPNFLTGMRPLSRVVGLVIGRRWELGKAYGTLKLLVSPMNVAGYSPTARVLSQVNDFLTAWTLTVDTTLYAPSGHTPEEFFVVGDRVQLVEYDTEAPALRDATVVAVNAGLHTIQVDVSGAPWVPGASTWELIYRDYAGSVGNAEQHDYAFIADAVALLLGASPRTFGP